MKHTKILKKTLKNKINKVNLLGNFAYYCFTYGVLTNLFSVRKTYRKYKHFKKLFQATFLLVFLTYLSFGLVCFFGSKRPIQQNMIFSIENEIIHYICSFCYGINLIISLPINISSCFEIFEENHLLKTFKEKYANSLVKFLPRLAVILFIFFLCYLPIDIILINTSSLLCLMVLQFIYPIFAYKKTFLINIFSFTSIMILMLFGIIGCIYMFFETIINYRAYLDSEFVS